MTISADSEDEAVEKAARSNGRYRPHRIYRTPSD